MIDIENTTNGKSFRMVLCLCCTHRKLWFLTTSIDYWHVIVEAAMICLSFSVVQKRYVFTLLLSWDDQRTKGRMRLVTCENLIVFDILWLQAIDTLINYETVKIFATETQEVSAYVELENIFRTIFIRFNVSLNLLSFGQQAIKGMGLVAVMVLAARATVSKASTTGDFVLIVT